MSIRNHIEEFRYKMQRECEKQDKPCEFCRYYYKTKDVIGGSHRGCFLNDLLDYISYQESKHG